MDSNRHQEPEPVLTRYRVWMTILGSVVKPQYEGFVDVWAENEDQAFEKAVRESRRTAHWDSSPESFRLDRVEVLR